MKEALERLGRKLRNMVTRGVIGRRASGGTYQVQWIGDRASDGVEHMEPQGLHFAAPADADGMTLAPFGDRSAAVIVCAQGATPSDALASGEGGLHYLGTYKVFLKADGTVALGSYNPPDFAAVASYVDARIAAIRTAYNLHTHTGVTTGGGTSGTPAAPLAAQATVASTKVKIEP